MRAPKSPVGRPVLEPIQNEDGTISAKDDEGNFVAQRLSVAQYENFCNVYWLGIKRGAALEREALIFEYTKN
jgi:hypothetical protein